MRRELIASIFLISALGALPASNWVVSARQPGADEDTYLPAVAALAKRLR
jgi:hypothetical protein